MNPIRFANCRLWKLGSSPSTEAGGPGPCLQVLSGTNSTFFSQLQFFQEGTLKGGTVTLGMWP